jgi:hypothetical protein
MPVPFLNVIAAPLALVVWLADQPWGPFVGPAIVGFTMVVAGIAAVRRAR